MLGQRPDAAVQAMSATGSQYCSLSALCCSVQPTSDLDPGLGHVVSAALCCSAPHIGSWSGLGWGLRKDHAYPWYQPHQHMRGAGKRLSDHVHLRDQPQQHMKIADTHKCLLLDLMHQPRSHNLTTSAHGVVLARGIEGLCAFAELASA